MIDIMNPKHINAWAKVRIYELVLRLLQQIERERRGGT